MQVRLRPWKNTDIIPLAAIANNKKIWDSVRDYFPHPYAIKNAEEWIAMQDEKKPVTHFAIEVDAKLAGGTGVILKEDVYRCSAEIGYWLGEEFWGKGIATEAIRQLMEKIIKDYPDVIRVYAETFAFNKASMKVLEKNGFHLESIRKKAVIKNGILTDDYVWVRFTREFTD